MFQAFHLYGDSLKYASAFHPMFHMVHLVQISSNFLPCEKVPGTQKLSAQIPHFNYGKFCSLTWHQLLRRFFVLRSTQNFCQCGMNCWADSFWSFSSHWCWTVSVLDLMVASHPFCKLPIASAFCILHFTSMRFFRNSIRPNQIQALISTPGIHFVVSDVIYTWHSRSAVIHKSLQERLSSCQLKSPLLQKAKNGLLYSASH